MVLANTRHREARARKPRQMIVEATVHSFSPMRSNRAHERASKCLVFEFLDVVSTSTRGWMHQQERRNMARAPTVTRRPDFQVPFFHLHAHIGLCDSDAL